MVKDTSTNIVDITTPISNPRNNQAGRESTELMMYSQISDGGAEVTVSYHMAFMLCRQVAIHQECDALDNHKEWWGLLIFSRS